MFADYAPLFDFLQEQGTKVYLVGGAVRDLLLNRPSHDLDFVVLGDAPHIARKTANFFHGAYYLMDKEHGIARVLFNKEPFPNLVLDFSQARGGTLESDLEARDFTINAIALDLSTRKVVDPLQGALHLHQKILRACNSESFLQDPIRTIRAFRFSLYLNLHIEAETKALLYKALPHLEKISGERQRDELFRMFSGGRSAAALRVLQHAGVMEIVIPELGALTANPDAELKSDSSIELSIRTLRNLDLILDFIEGKRELVPETLFSNLIFVQMGRYRLKLLDHLQKYLNPDRTLRGLICLAGIFFPFFADMTHKIYQPDAASMHFDRLNERFKSLALSKAEIQYLQKMISHGGWLYALANNSSEAADITTSSSDNVNARLDRRQIYRYFRACGDAGIDICLLSVALFGAQSGWELDQTAYVRLLQTICELFDGYWEENPGIVNLRPVINGDDLIRELRATADETLGQILEQIKEEQATGTIQTRDQALNFAREKLLQLRG